MKKIVVTGGAGQIAYSLLFRLAAGEVFGKDVSLSLSILDLPEMEGALQGVAMELQDCAFPLLDNIEIGSDPRKMFNDADAVFLIGAKPRGPGMERKDLLLENAKIFVEQGKALNEVAKHDVTVLVVGNPCNTNCLIARHFAKRIDPNRFFAMTRLDENRARAVLAKKAGVSIQSVSALAIWGNHSSTQVPDFFHSTIQGKPITEVLHKEQEWLNRDFFSFVQKRGAEVIAARGKSSAASAASAAIDTMRSLLGTVEETFFSVALSSEGNPYSVAEDLVFSFPCRRVQDKIEIVKGWDINPFLQERIRQTEKELVEEKNMIASLLL